jgi:hypothetical protein
MKKKVKLFGRGETLKAGVKNVNGFHSIKFSDLKKLDNTLKLR